MLPHLLREVNMRSLSLAFFHGLACTRMYIPFPFFPRQNPRYLKFRIANTLTVRLFSLFTFNFSVSSRYFVNNTVFHHATLQISLYHLDHSFILHISAQDIYQQFMIQRVEVLRQVKNHRSCIAFFCILLYLLNRIFCTPPRTVTIASV